MACKRLRVIFKTWLGALPDERDQPLKRESRDRQRQNGGA